MRRFAASTAVLCLLLTALLLPVPARAGGPEHLTPCVDGAAGGFACDRVDLLEQMPLGSIGGGSGNDLWGWTDPLTGKEYALMGRSGGTSIVDVSDPENPVFLGDLPSETTESPWRDIKTYRNHMYVVSEASGHGIQVFDLTQLRTPPPAPAVFTADSTYAEIGRSHNIVINEESGFAYAVGSTTCSGGLHMIDLSDPANPTNAGCFSADGYTHDAQCVIYDGPDSEHDGQEICFNLNEDTVTIVDVTNKATPVQLSRTGYTGTGYTHQGWLTEDHTYFLLNDETDEIDNGHNTITRIWDMTDLDSPQVIGTYTAAVASSDHNLYIKGDFAYLANYRSGLRVLSLGDVAAGNLVEAAFFDTYTADNNAGTQGAWSVYPFFDSGTVLVSDIQSGLFLLRPILCSSPLAPFGLTASAAGDHRIDLSWSGGMAGETFTVYREFGTCPAVPNGTGERIAQGLTGTTFSDTSASGQIEYAYTVTTVDPSGFCESPVGVCSSATTSGICNAPPSFGGIDQAENQGTEACTVSISWNPASPNCGPGVAYGVHRGTDPAFMPSVANRVANGLTGTSWNDTDTPGGQPFYYVVRATDTGNSVEEANLEVLGATATGPAADGDFMTGAEIGDPSMTVSSPSSSSSLIGDRAGGGSEGGGAEHIGWETSTSRAFTGSRSFFSTYENGQCSALVSPLASLSPGESSELSFWTLFGIEERFDGGVVQISTDGGTSWSLLPLDQGYPGTFRSSNDACGFLPDTPSFTGPDLVWTRYTADLSAWAGTQIRLRWIFSTDSGLTLEGWYVDDISISHVQLPGSCLVGLVFGDGFESGSVSNWSLAVP